MGQAGGVTSNASTSSRPDTRDAQQTWTPLANPARTRR
jgi:hypothetical protein